MLLEYTRIAYDYFAYKGVYWGSQFLNHLDGKDWVALVTYDLKPTIQVDFTRNKAEVEDALRNLSFPGFSEANLFDALVDTLDKLDRVSGKKAILLITTGMNTFGKATLDETIDKIKKANVSIFCSGVAESELMMAETRSGRSSLDYMQAKNQLQTFADLTGGLAWFPRFEGEVPSLFRSVVGFLRSEYDLGFPPSNAALDGSITS
jgi:VWFA-related protein